MISAVIIFVIVLGLGVNYKEPNCGGFKTWLKVSMGVYLTDGIVCMNQLMHVMKKRHESLWLLLAMFIINVCNTGWYVYGNIIYYKNRDECVVEELAPQLTSTMFIMMVFGYATMCKCCCITTIMAYLVPTLIQLYRRQQNNGWEGAGTNLLRNL